MEEVLDIYERPYDPQNPVICFDERPCLDRRIGDIGTLASEVIPWAQRRNRKRITITWSFSKNKARNKLQRLYKSIQEFT